MPATCALTGKSYRKSHKRSKSMQNNITKVRPNLLVRKGKAINEMLGMQVFAPNKRIKVSAKALKTLKKQHMEMEAKIAANNEKTKAQGILDKAKHLAKKELEQKA
jgi:ribosomal protein L28